MASADHAAVDLVDLPEELLSLLCRNVGIDAALRALPANNRLHNAWQAAVREARVPISSFTEQDIAVLCKLKNIERLKFEAGVSRDAPYDVPLWRIVSTTAKHLSCLTSLTFNAVPGCLGLLRTLHGAGSLAQRLKGLCLISYKEVLECDDIWALVELEALHTLQLGFDHISITEAQLKRISSRISTSLRSLHLVAIGKGLSPSSQAIFPGSLANLTSLTLTSTDDREDTQCLVQAVSGLTNLRQFKTSYFCDTHDFQRAALGQLKRLTRLELLCADREAGGQPSFTVLPELPELVVLECPQHSVTDPFEHPSLTELAAGRLVVGAQWKGKTAERCKLKELDIGDENDDVWYVHDELLENMPLLPCLSIFATAVCPSAGRYLHIAALLRRQASTLHGSALITSSSCEFEEALPQQLPSCRELTLNSASRHTLQTLAMCSLPALEQLVLCITGPAEPVPADLAWLTRLPQLKKAYVYTQLHGPAGEQFKADVQAMMQGTGVALDMG